MSAGTLTTLTAHGSRLLGLPGSLGTSCPFQRRGSRRDEATSGGGHGHRPCEPAPEPLPGPRLGCAASVSNPSSLPKGEKNRPVVLQGCQGDIFLAAAQSQPLSWQGLWAGSWGSPSVPTLGCPCPGPPSSMGQPAAGCSQEGVGGSQAWGGGAGGPWKSCADMKNAKALLELEACGAGGPFWLGFGKSWLCVAEQPSEHHWFPFGRLSKELPPWKHVSPLRWAVFVCLGDEPHYLSFLTLEL